MFGPCQPDPAASATHPDGGPDLYRHRLDDRWLPVGVVVRADRVQAVVSSPNGHRLVRAMHHGTGLLGFASEHAGAIATAAAVLILATYLVMVARRAARPRRDSQRAFSPVQRMKGFQRAGHRCEHVARHE